MPGAAGTEGCTGTGPRSAGLMGRPAGSWEPGSMTGSGQGHLFLDSSPKKTFAPSRVSFAICFFLV